MSSPSISCPPGNCLNSGSIELLAEGLIGEPGLSLLLDHIETCPQCQGLLDSHITKSGKSFFSFANTGPPNSLTFCPEEPSVAEENIKSCLSETQFSRLLQAAFGQQFQNPKRALIQSQFLVFECLDANSGKSVWAWCLRPEWANLTDITQSLCNRAHLANLASDPSLAQIKKWSPSPLGPIVITEIPAGKNLLQTWNQALFSSVETATIAIQLLGGLETLHEKGLILGPITLGDIFVQTNDSQPLGTLKACWGNVVFRHGLGFSGITVTSQAFQSPEQSLGKTPDFRSDFFCFGSVIFSLLTGEKPWPDTPEQTQHPKPFNAPQLTTPWRNILRQLWDLFPEDRLVDHQTLAVLLAKITNDNALQSDQSFFK